MRAMEINDLLSFHFVSGVKAAPSRKTAAFVLQSVDEKENGYRSDIWLYENGACRRLTADGKSAGPVWENAEHILFPAMREKADRDRAEHGERFSVWYRLNIHGGEAEKAFELPVRCNSIKRLDADHWFFLAQIDRAYPDEYRMDVEQREKLQKERKENADYHILTDAEYRMNGAGYFEGMTTALFVYDMTSGVVQRITEPGVNITFAEACGEEIFFGSSVHGQVQRQDSQVYAWNLADGTVRAVYGGTDYDFYDVFPFEEYPVFLASDYQIAGLNQNPAFYRIENGKMELLCAPDLAIGCSVGTDCRLGGGSSAQMFRNALYFTCTVESRCELRKLKADGNITIVNRAEGSLDGFAICEDGSIFGTGLFENRLTELYEIGRGKKLTCLSDFNAEIMKDIYVSVPQKLSIRSAGRRIDGWVLPPRDYDPEKQYPAVLEIHGGPKTVFGEVLHHEMQVLTSRGYFVFFCNPIGSDGRGDAFADIRGKYGTVDYRNIMDFTDAVLEKYPQIDSKRVAVTGGSYGGFMTNWIIGHTDRFACAASQRSISNWFSFYGASDIGIFFNNDQNDANIFDGQKQVWEHSPLKYAGNAKTPTLFIHSEEDYRCPIDQGLQMYAALLERGVDTRFVWFKGENHDLSRSGKPKHRMKRLTEIVEWIEKYTR